MASLVVGEFAGPKELLAAVRSLREAGLHRLDTYSPFPVEGTEEALGVKKSGVPLAVLIAGLAGAGVGYSMQYFCNAIDWPIVVGNRPAHAAPLFVPITFELGVLFASFGALFSLLWQARLPEPWHRTQLVEQFRNATLSGFWVSVEQEPAGPEAERLAESLRSLGATSVSVLAEPEP